MATGRKDNFKNLRVFGCRVLVPRLGKHVPRFSQNKVPLKGVFLGYIPFTDKLIQWYDEKTGKVKITTHATFDEGFSDLPLEDLPLGASQVVRLNHGMRTDPDPAPISCKDLDFFVYPFAEPKVISIPIPSDTKDPTFGLTLVDDSYLHRTFVSKVKEKSPVGTAFTKAQLKRFRGSFITDINGKPVFSSKQAKERLQDLYNEHILKLPPSNPSTSSSPTVIPSSNPTGTPSSVPSFSPSGTPSKVPTPSPTDTPSSVPSSSPSDTTSKVPSSSPSKTPSSSPTGSPSPVPSSSPTATPSKVPSSSPTGTPSPRPVSPDIPSLNASSSMGIELGGVPSGVPSFSGGSHAMGIELDHIPSDVPSGSSGSNAMGIELDGIPSGIPSGSSDSNVMGIELDPVPSGVPSCPGHVSPDGSPLGTELSAGVDSLLFEPVSFPHGE